jgi:putative glutamine amidotransferase
MNTPPLILITTSLQKAGEEFGDQSVSLSNQYVRAVAAAGGVPWVAPNLPSPALARAMVARAAGVLLTGGADVGPELYARGLSRALRRTVSAPERERDLFELQVLAEVFRQRRPLLAICRGLQILNVALGGSLLVDIGSQTKHALNHQRLDRKDKIVHDVELTPGSLIARITGARVMGVNSSHHQAAGRVAGALRVTARSSDGIVEALELGAGQKGRPFLLAVQFHPERLSARHPPHQALIESFVGACALAGHNSL